MTRKAGDIEHIIFSPPFSNVVQVQDTKFYRKMRMDTISGDPLKERAGSRKMTMGPGNIGSLEHGNINKIITSPPFGSENQGKPNLITAGLGRRDGKFRGNTPMGLAYSDSKANIGNLAYGNELVAELFSGPPWNIGAEGPTEKLSCGCVAEMIDQKPTPGYGKYAKYFAPESIQHPAKANTNMLADLIEEFVDEGDTVLDPMGGTGSTAIIAAAMKRNAIVVELESKFYGWIKKNIKRLEATPGEHGHITAIHGDARNLYELLKANPVGNVVTSPPYADSVKGKHNLKKRLDRQAEIGIDMPVTSPGRSGYWLNHNYSKSPENIGTLPMGTVNRILASPPYSEGIGHGGGNPTLVKDKNLHLHGKGSYPGRENIGNLKHGKIDDVATDGYVATDGSQTYLSEMFKLYQQSYLVLKPGGKMILIVRDFLRDKKVCFLHEDTIRLCLYAGFRFYRHLFMRLTGLSFWRIIYAEKNPDVDLRPLYYDHILVFVKPQADQQDGEPVSKILMSPPYATFGDGGGIMRKGYDGWTERPGRQIQKQLSHFESKNPDNIERLPYGKVDKIVTSPPFGETNKAPRVHSDTTADLQGRANIGRRYSKSKQNIGNLKYGK